MMNFGEPLGEGDDPQYYKNQVGVCFAAYRNLNNIAQVTASPGPARCGHRPRQCKEGVVGGDAVGAAADRLPTRPRAR